MALTDKLTAIANAIRAKTGSSTAMTLSEMPTEIASIPTGTTPTGTKTITENGTYDVAAFANADVNVPEIFYPYCVAIARGRVTYGSNPITLTLKAPYNVTEDAGNNFGVVISKNITREATGKTSYLAYIIMWWDKVTAYTRFRLGSGEQNSTSQAKAPLICSGISAYAGDVLDITVVFCDKTMWLANPSAPIEMVNLTDMVTIGGI